MTYMLQGNRKREAIKAMQRGTFMAYAAQERYRVDHPLTEREKLIRGLTRNLSAWMRRLGERVGLGIATGMVTTHMQTGSMGGYGWRAWAWDSGIHAPGLNAQGLKPMPPYTPLHETTGMKPISRQAQRVLDVTHNVGEGKECP